MYPGLCLPTWLHTWNSYPPYHTEQRRKQGLQSRNGRPTITQPGSCRARATGYHCKAWSLCCSPISVSALRPGKGQWILRGLGMNGVIRADLSERAFLSSHDVGSWKGCLKDLTERERRQPGTTAKWPEVHRWTTGGLCCKTPVCLLSWGCFLCQELMGQAQTGHIHFTLAPLEAIHLVP